MTEVTLNPSADTFLYDYYGDRNAGTYLTFHVCANGVFGERRALLRFDLSSLPAGATINSATLKLTANSSENSKTYNLYKVSDANGDWVEGTKNLAQAGAGEPCWDAKEADGSGGVTTAWAGSAGAKTAGTDYINTVLATYTGATVDGGDGYNDLELTFTADGLFVLEDLAGSADNNGFLLDCDNQNQTEFYNRNAATEAIRPVLTISYSTGGGTYKYLPLLGVG